MLSNFFSPIFNLTFSKRRWPGDTILAMLRLSNVFTCLEGSREDTNTSRDHPPFAHSQSRRTEQRHMFPLRSVAGDGSIQHWHPEGDQHLFYLGDRQESYIGPGAAQNKLFVAALRVVASLRYIVVELSLKSHHILTIFPFMCLGLQNCMLCCFPLSVHWKK